MLPRNPSCPSSGPTTLTAAAVVVHASLLSSDSSVARKRTAVRRVCQYSMDRYVRSKAPVPDEAARRARGADAPADHRERRRAARGARPRADVDQRRSPSTPACAARPSTATSPTRRRCSRPARRTGAPRTRRPTSRTWAAIEDPAERTETALARALRVLRRAPRRCTTSLLRDEPLVPIVQRRLGDFYGYLRAIQDILIAGRGLRGRAARRTRAAIGHALAFPTWRSLTREQGLDDGEAVALMSRARRGRRHGRCDKSRRCLGPDEGRLAE